MLIPWLLLVWASTVAPASAEWFGDLYLGGALTGTQDIDADVVRFRNVRFDTSLAVGGRGGYWFEDFDYLGLALDVVHFRPDVGAQTVQSDQGVPCRWPNLTSRSSVCRSISWFGIHCGGMSSSQRAACSPISSSVRS